MPPQEETQQDEVIVQANEKTGHVSLRKSETRSSSFTNEGQSTVANKRWILKQYPEGKFDATRDVELETKTIDLLNKQTLLEQEDSLVVKVCAISVDAFIRTRMDKEAYHGGHAINEAVEALGYGTVVLAGPKCGFKVGDEVLGLMPVAEYAVLRNSQGLNKKKTLPRASPTSSLGMLGISGLAAYIGMFVAPPKGPQKGDVVVVSAASGAVGSLAAQMAKQAGAAKVIGVAGGAHKKDYLLNTLKLDGAVDYKHPDKSIEEQLDELCPDGIDFFFDNVGGTLLDAVLKRIRIHGRVCVCGAASQYDTGAINNKSKILGPSHYIMLAEKSASMTGYNMMHYSRKFGEAIAYLAWHYYRGTIQLQEQVENGIEAFPRALEKLFSGGHCGRLIVKFSV